MKICKECGNDREATEIAKRMGFRPDIAYAKIMELEKEIKDVRKDQHEKTKEACIKTINQCRSRQPGDDWINYNNVIERIKEVVI